ncbi:hypothetical protein GLO73106DRAFT_00026440 [Gloeocapsa sp. PCC 73106]|nr:hypothetical protein GLO73106DRAFT_00026440 [Gloeocapsa sp. PCC 73106]
MSVTTYIDFKNNTSARFAFEQRGKGFNRIVGSAVDIGAYEVQEQTETTTVTVQVSPTSVTENGTPNLVYTFTRTGSTNSALNNVNFGVGGTATFSSDYTQTGASSYNQDLRKPTLYLVC